MFSHGPQMLTYAEQCIVVQDVCIVEYSSGTIIQENLLLANLWAAYAHTMCISGVCKLVFWLDASLLRLELKEIGSPSHVIGLSTILDPWSPLSL